MWIDTHAHVYMEQFDDDRPDVLRRASEVGIEKIIVPAEDLLTSRRIVELCCDSQMLRGAVGIHPQSCREVELEPELEQLRQLAPQPGIVAIGEIGLDYFHQYAPRRKQIDTFAAQIELAIELGKPVIIHNRNADIDMMDMLNTYIPKGMRAVMHCFSSSYDFALKCLDRGLYLSFAGQVTYPSANDLREVIRKIPVSAMLLETDSPYLSPQHKRGRRNEPMHMIHTAELVAQVKEIPISELASVTTRNAKSLFGLASQKANAAPSSQVPF